MATIEQTLQLIRQKHYHEINPHQKHFINQMLSKKEFSPAHEKFIFWIARRFNIFVQKTFFPLKCEKPALPTVIVKNPVEPDNPFTNPPFNAVETDSLVQTGLGLHFDSLATISQLWNYRLKAPLNLKFMNQNLFTIYGMVSRTKARTGQAFLEMAAHHSRYKEERLKVQAFLIAMENLESVEEPTEPKVVKEKCFAKKGRDLVRRWK